MNHLKSVDSIDDGQFDPWDEEDEEDEDIKDDAANGDVSRSAMRVKK